MGRCTFCGNKTDNMVNDNIGGKSFLCKDCQSKFKRCKECNCLYLEDELEGELCENCG